MSHREQPRRRNETPPLPLTRPSPTHRPDPVCCALPPALQDATQVNCKSGVKISQKNQKRIIKKIDGGAHFPIRDVQREKKKQHKECNWKCNSSSLLLRRLPSHRRCLTWMEASITWESPARVGPTSRHRWWHRGDLPGGTPGVRVGAVQSQWPAEPGTRGSGGLTCPARSVSRLFGVRQAGGGGGAFLG